MTSSNVLANPANIMASILVYPVKMNSSVNSAIFTGKNQKTIMRTRDFSEFYFSLTQTNEKISFTNTSTPKNVRLVLLPSKRMEEVRQ